MHLSLHVIGFCLCTWLSYAHPDVKVHENRLSAECHHLDKCLSRQFTDSLEHYNCHCGPFCSQLDTCCLDSPFRTSGLDSTSQRAVCRKVGGKSASSYFMVDKCPLKGKWKDAYQNLCEDKSSDNNNLTSLIPVTSLSTNMTYKNYFCFMCHEAGVEYISWIVKVKEVGKYSSYLDKDTLLNIRNVNNTWVTPDGKYGNLVPVLFTVKVPPELENRAKVCIPDMISSCSEEWPNDEIRTRCGTHMSATYISQNYRNTWYRNKHCALCNFEDLKYAKCTREAHQVHSLHTRDVRCKNPTRKCLCRNPIRCCKCRNDRSFTYSAVFYEHSG